MFFMLLFLQAKFDKKLFLKLIFLIFFHQVFHITHADVIQSNCILQSKKYVPARSLWLSRVFTDLANSHEKLCLTIDSRYKNKNGPGRYRWSTDNPEKQVCYFNKANDDVFYNTFISEQIKGEKYHERIYFKIEKVRSKTDKENFDAKRTLEDGASDVRPREFFDDAEPEQIGAGAKRPGDFFEHFWRKRRKSARPEFLAG